MKRLLTFVSLASLIFGAGSANAQFPERPPNIIFILSDRLGYANVGCSGQKLVKTPNLDRMVTEGMRFTQAFCGISVCAPSLCALMTGFDIGHAPIRVNHGTPPEGQEPLPAGTVTVASLLKAVGYDTACMGKWDMEFVVTTGDPDCNGFDYFYGYNCQTDAHNYYPDPLWRNSVNIGLYGKQYSHDLIAADALNWLHARLDKGAGTGETVSGLQRSQLCRRDCRTGN